MEECPSRLVHSFPDIFKCSADFLKLISFNSFGFVIMYFVSFLCCNKSVLEKNNLFTNEKNVMISFNYEQITHIRFKMIFLGS